MTTTRRLAAIFAADVAGYSRLIGTDEGGTLQALKAIRAELIDPTIAAHNGRLVKTRGDGLLVEFGSVVDEGYSDATVGELLGHARRSVTQRHYIRRPDAAFAAADRVAARIAKSMEGEGEVIEAAERFQKA
jgi:class 3 adenylate cyclase